VRLVWHLLPDITAYKSYIIASTALNLLLFAGLLRRLTGSASLAALGVPVVAALFQFRVFDDPFLAYEGLLQYILLLTLLSLLALDRYLTGGRRRWLVASAALYLLLTLSYELSYPLFLLHAGLMVARGRGWRATGLMTLPFAAAAVACAGASVILRALPGAVVLPGYQTNPDPIAFAKTLGKQLLAALPLSYYVNRPADVFPPYGLMMRSWGVACAAAVAFALTLALLARLRRDRPDGGGIGSRGLALLGLLFWALPGLLTSLTPKYQDALTPGLGYLPVYVQYYGVGLLLLAGASSVCRRLSHRPGLARSAAVVAAAAVALVAAHTYAANAAVAEYLAPLRQVRENVEAALEAGLIDGVPDGATLLLDHCYPAWQTDMRPYPEVRGTRTASEYFYYIHSGKKVQTVVPPLGTVGAVPPPAGVPGPVYEVRDVCDGGRGGHVLLLRRAGPDGGVTGAVRVFVRGDPEPAPFLLAGQRAPGGSAGGSEFLLWGRDLPVVGRGPGGAVYALPPALGPFLADSLAVTELEPTPTQAVWGAGFYGEERSRKACWRWCSGQGTLLLVNSAAETRTVRLQMTLSCGVGREVRLEGGPLDETVRVPAGGLRLERDVRLEPGVLKLRLLSDGPPLDAPGDPRTLAFTVSDFRLGEARGPRPGEVL
jgi:hypothetical protein